MTRRITRAKQGIKASGVPFGMPAASERAERLAAVLNVLYLIFNEGYASTSGPDLQRVELAAEAWGRAVTAVMIAFGRSAVRAPSGAAASRSGALLNWRRLAYV